MVQYFYYKGIGSSKCHEIITALGSEARAHTNRVLISKSLYNAFRTYSPWSAEHSVRVGYHLKNFAETVGINTVDAASFGLCACLHDIGKLAVPRHILDKPDSLTSGERELIEIHATEGLNCLSDLSGASVNIAKEMILHHHENFDGSGYPDGLLSEDQSLLVRMIRIVDFYDAVHFDRPYRLGLSEFETIALMEKNARLFAPDLFHKFKRELRSIDKFSQGL